MFCSAVWLILQRLAYFASSLPIFLRLRFLILENYANMLGSGQFPTLINPVYVRLRSRETTSLVAVECFPLGTSKAKRNPHCCHWHRCNMQFQYSVCFVDIPFLDCLHERKKLFYVGCVHICGFIVFSVYCVFWFLYE